MGHLRLAEELLDLPVVELAGAVGVELPELHLELRRREALLRHEELRHKPRLYVKKLTPKRRKWGCILLVSRY